MPTKKTVAKKTAAAPAKTKPKAKACNHWTNCGTEGKCVKSKCVMKPASK